jgi:hypothetical protein
LVLGGGVALVGCKSDPAGKPAPSVAPAPSGTVLKTGMKVGNEVLLKQSGTAPFSVQVDSDGLLRIYDVTDKKDVLPPTPVKASVLLKADVQTGILLGQNPVLKGPLPAWHVYQIWLEPKP